jgi:small conductance mechanosensitive channel
MNKSQQYSSWALVMYLLMPLMVMAQNTPISPSGSDKVQNISIALEGPADALLESRLLAMFARIEALQDVRAKVNEGVVELYGTVPRKESKKIAQDLASRLEGVVYVENRIEEQTDIENRVSPTIKKVQQFLSRIVQQLPVVGIAGGVLVLFYWIPRLLFRWDRLYVRVGIDPLIRNLIRQVLRSLIFLLGLVLALEILDLTTLVRALIGTAGLIGISLGFAFRHVAENYLAGLFLSVQSPFSMNDLIQVDRYEGKVVRLSSREIVLMTLEGNHLRIPNSIAYQSIIVNFTRNPLRRFDFEVGVSVAEDLKFVKIAGCEALRGMKGVLTNPEPFMRVERLGDYNVIVRFFGWVDQREADLLKAKSQAIRTVKTALEKADITMPEPMQSVLLRPQAVDKIPHVKQEPPTFTVAELGVDEADVAVDTQLDRQIEKDRATSTEKSLL